MSEEPKYKLITRGQRLYQIGFFISISIIGLIAFSRLEETPDTNTMVVIGILAAICVIIYMFRRGNEREHFAFELRDTVVNEEFNLTGKIISKSSIEIVFASPIYFLGVVGPKLYVFDRNTMEFIGVEIATKEEFCQRLLNNKFVDVYAKTMSIEDALDRRLRDMGVEKIPDLDDMNIR